MNKILRMACLVFLCSKSALAAPNGIEASSVISLEDRDAKINFSIVNKGPQVVSVSKPGNNGSPVIITKPNGEVKQSVIITDRIDGLPASTSLPPLSKYEVKEEPLENINGGRMYEVGIYKIFLAVNIVEGRMISNELLVYREESAPRLLPHSAESIDSPEFFAEALKSESFQQYQEDLRSAQIAATEGTKQFFFANPFTVALSVDGKRGLKVALFATNVERKPKQFPKENSETNYLEMKTPTGQVLRVDMGRMMKPAEKHDGALAVGETRKWIGDVSRTLEQEEITAPGHYIVTWVVEDTEVGSFTFVRPEPKLEAQPAPK